MTNNLLPLKTTVRNACLILLTLAALAASTVYTHRTTHTAAPKPLDTLAVDTLADGEAATAAAHRKKLKPFEGPIPYDTLFRRYADSLGWDWHLLAAVAYVESRFNAEAANASGAVGLMQLMEHTTRAMGVDPDRRCEPEQSILAATRLFERLADRYDHIPDSIRPYFVLAAYNAGGGKVREAMREADSLGYNKYRWNENVELFMGGETRCFIQNVRDKYQEFRINF